MKHLQKSLFFLFLLLVTHGFSQWTPMGLDSNKLITTLNFLNDDLGYAMVTSFVSQNKTLEKTTDGGNTWAVLPLPLSGPEFQDVHFNADGIGVAVFRDLNDTVTPTQIYQTLNDGATWQNISPDTTATGIGSAKCQFLDVNNGYFATDLQVYKTTDGGSSWTETALPGYAVSMDFLDVDHGTLGLFDGTFNYLGSTMTTTNGGTTWQTHPLTELNSVISEVGQLTADIAYAASVKWGSYNVHKFYWTIDAGVNWDTVAVPAIPVDGFLSDIFFQDPLHGRVAIASFTSGNYIYVTTDGGTTWALEDTVPQFTVTDMELTATRGYIAGQLQQLYTLDIAQSIMDPRSGTARIFPNPVSPGATLHWETETPIESAAIYDATGRLVVAMDAVSNACIVPPIAPGIYWMQLRNGSTTHSARLVVQ